MTRPTVPFATPSVVASSRVGFAMSSGAQSNANTTRNPAGLKCPDNFFRPRLGGERMTDYVNKCPCKLEVSIAGGICEGEGDACFRRNFAI